MTRRDWAHLIAWLALVYLVWDDRAVEIAGLVTGVDSAKRVARLEAAVENQKHQIEVLEERLRTQDHVDERQDRDIERLKARNE